MSPERVLFQVVFALLIGATCRAGPFWQHSLKHPLKWDPRLKDDPGKPLFLTPYIQKGDIEEGKLFHGCSQHQPPLAAVEQELVVVLRELHECLYKHWTM